MNYFEIGIGSEHDSKLSLEKSSKDLLLSPIPNYQRRLSSED